MLLLLVAFSLGPALLFFFDDSGQRVERITATCMDN